MGIADFYLKINFRKHNYDEFEKIYQTFANERIFRILNKEYESRILSLECQFDNFIPSVIIAFNNLYPFMDNIYSIETHGIVREFVFNSVEDFLYHVFSINKNSLLSYYEQLGYFAIDSEKFYSTRNKLRKYYTKIK